jgi:hypothetical protein
MALQLPMPDSRTGQRVAAFLALVLLLANGTVNAQQAQIRASLSDGATVWVGQEVTLVVELLAPGYFASAASFDLPDPVGILFMPPAGHPLVSNETIEGVLYSVQRHELRVWPMRAGAPLIPPVTARFSYKRAPLDKETIPASVSTVALALAVEVPPGAENLGTVISARNLKVTESWDPEPGEEAIVAGTAFKRTILFTAPDVPGMVYPPFPAEPINGLGVYRKQQLLDREDRGSFTGAREDVITYLCKTPGRYIIPATRFSWFDLNSNTLRVEEFPARTLNVVVNPALAAASGEVTAGQPPPWRKSWSWLLWPLVLIAGLALVSLFLFGSPAGLQRLSNGWKGATAPMRAVHLQALNPQGPRQPS